MELPPLLSWTCSTTKSRYGVITSSSTGKVALSVHVQSHMTCWFFFYPSMHKQRYMHASWFEVPLHSKQVNRKLEGKSKVWEKREKKNPKSAKASYFMHHDKEEKETIKWYTTHFYYGLTRFDVSTDDRWNNHKSAAKPHPSLLHETRSINSSAEFA